MSRSNPTAKNPATRFMRWAGGEKGGGRVTYYDKEAEQEKEVALPFSFLVLDELNTITGFSESDRSSFWANEVRNMQKSEFVVKTGAGVKARGKYADLADVRSKGAKYAKSMYIAFKDDEGELAIGNLKLFGAALTAWIDFNKAYDPYKCAVTITDTPKQGKKGSTTFFSPVFEARKIDQSTNAQAEKLDEELQVYLKGYLNREPDDEPVASDEMRPSRSMSPEDVEIEDVETKADSEAKTAEKAPEKADEGDDKIPLADIPF